MSLGAHLAHRCSLQRADETPDPYQNAVRTWRAVAVEVPCRLVTSAKRFVANDRAAMLLVTATRLLVPAGTDVREGDRVIDVTLEDGGEEPGPFAVQAVLPRRTRGVHHLTLELERIS